ncbi:RICIN domain-containing protein [Streptomyces sp. NPDC094049]|uniref:RICIN domain-containing protein n=1 Tax=Streptomyces sp. NPDC094049 TaxID=3154987 RepID=UPI00331FA559
MKSLKAFGVASAAVVTVTFGSGTASASPLPQPLAVVNAYSGQCMVMGTMDNGDNIIQHACNLINDRRQVWDFIQTADNNQDLAWFLRSQTSGKCIGVSSSLNNGPVVIQYTCNGAVDQKWWFTSNGFLRNVYSGKCLGVGSSKQIGKQLIQWPCNSNAKDQKWLTYRAPYDRAPFDSEVPMPDGEVLTPPITSEPRPE